MRVKLKADGRFSSDKEMTAFVVAVEKVAFYKKDYQVSAKFLTLQELKEGGISPYKYIDFDVDAVVTAVDRKDGNGTFLVMRIFMLNGSFFDLPLSYKHSFEEGDEINPSSLRMSEEEYLDKKHVFCTDGVHIKEG